MRQFAQAAAVGVGLRGVVVGNEAVPFPGGAGGWLGGVRYGSVMDPLGGPEPPSARRARASAGPAGRPRGSARLTWRIERPPCQSPWQAERFPGGGLEALVEEVIAAIATGKEGTLLAEDDQDSFPRVPQLVLSVRE